MSRSVPARRRRRRGESRRGECPFLSSLAGWLAGRLAGRWFGVGGLVVERQSSGSQVEVEVYPVLYCLFSHHFL